MMQQALIEMNYKKPISQILGAEKWKVSIKPIISPIFPSLEGYEYKLQLLESERMVAYFYLYPMPGCCGICISTSSYVVHEYRNKGLGTLLNKLRIDLAKGLNYGVLICTDISNNVYQRKILKKNGWEDIYEFMNPRTRHNIMISVVNLEKMKRSLDHLNDIIYDDIDDEDYEDEDYDDFDETEITD